MASAIGIGVAVWATWKGISTNETKIAELEGEIRAMDSALDDMRTDLRAREADDKRRDQEIADLRMMVIRLGEKLDELEEN